MAHKSKDFPLKKCGKCSYQWYPVDSRKKCPRCFLKKNPCNETFLECKRCYYQWTPLVKNKKVCPRCKSREHIKRPVYELEASETECLGMTKSGTYISGRTSPLQRYGGVSKILINKKTCKVCFCKLKKSTHTAVSASGRISLLCKGEKKYPRLHNELHNKMLLMRQPHPQSYKEELREEIEGLRLKFIRILPLSKSPKDYSD